MAKYTIGFDDVLTSRMTKQTTVIAQSYATDDVAEFVDMFNNISLAMPNKDGYTKTIQLVRDENGLIGATLRYVPKERK